MKYFYLLLFIFYLNIFPNENHVHFNYSFSQEIDDSIKKTESIDTLKFKMKKSPWGAVLRSAIIPGLGQYYNESYWKIPVIIGAFAYLGYQWNYNNDLYLKYKNLFQQSVTTNLVNNNYYKLREFYRDQRDLFAIYIGLAYLLNLIDAYVDAHLFDFDVSENTLSKNFVFGIKIKL